MEGDYIKFQGTNFNNIYHGQIIEVSRSGYIGVKIDEKDTRNHYPIGLTLYIDSRQILQNYSAKLVQYLTPRLALKHLWKNFIFREVKVTKNTNLLHVDYHYIGKTGFEKVKRFKSLTEAYANICKDLHHNIVPCYSDYFGFTTDKALRNNDYYYDREIFFSKKCYCELDWSAEPTADFALTGRYFNNTSPLSDALICGIVENGEKGLFYRKWFVCSPEFLTLWTMVCEPSDNSLCEKQGSEWSERPERWNPSWSGGSRWNKIEAGKDKPKRKTKELDTLIKELDTSDYSVNLKCDIKIRKHKYMIHNVERTALYFPNIYKKVAKTIFSTGFLKSESYEEEREFTDSFQKNLVKNIMWPQKLYI